jgi:hypothetical protein
MAVQVSQNILQKVFIMGHYKNLPSLDGCVCDDGM